MGSGVGPILDEPPRPKKGHLVCLSVLSVDLSPGPVCGPGPESYPDILETRRLACVTWLAFTVGQITPLISHI